MLKQSDMPANGHVRQARRYRKRQYHSATFRALAGAYLLLDIPVKPRGLQHAATMVGSSGQYIAAMRTLITADAWHLIDAVLDGRTPLLEAAAGMRKRTSLLRAYRESDADARKALGEGAGVDNIWADVLEPNLS